MKKPDQLDIMLAEHLDDTQWKYTLKPGERLYNPRNGNYAYYNGPEDYLFCDYLGNNLSPGEHIVNWPDGIGMAITMFVRNMGFKIGTPYSNCIVCGLSMERRRENDNWTYYIYGFPANVHIRCCEKNLLKFPVLRHPVFRRLPENGSLIVDSEGFMPHQITFSRTIGLVVMRHNGEEKPEFRLKNFGYRDMWETARKKYPGVPEYPFIET